MTRINDYWFNEINMLVIPLNGLAHTLNFNKLNIECNKSGWPSGLRRQI